MPTQIGHNNIWVLHVGYIIIDNTPFALILYYNYTRPLTSGHLSEQTKHQQNHRDINNLQKLQKVDSSIPYSQKFNRKLTQG